MELCCMNMKSFIKYLTMFILGMIVGFKLSESQSSENDISELSKKNNTDDFMDWVEELISPSEF